MQSELYERIKAARHFAGLTQTELGAALKTPVTKVSVSNWEKKSANDGNMPTSKRIKEIAEATNVPYLWLLSDDSSINEIYGKTAEQARDLNASILKTIMLLTEAAESGKITEDEISLFQTMAANINDRKNISESVKTTKK